MKETVSSGTREMHLAMHHPSRCVAVPLVPRSEYQMHHHCLVSRHSILVERVMDVILAPPPPSYPVGE